MQYKFEDILKCNMCAAPTEQAKILGRRMNRSQGVRPTGKVGISTTIMKCNSCSLVFSNPLPIPEDLNQHYGIPAEEYWTAKEFELDLSFFDSRIETFKKLYVEKDNIEVLDIGAGLGKCMLALEHHGFTAYGIEPSEPFYKRAIERMGISEERLSYASVESADFSPGQFDFITFGAVLEHIYDPSLAIQKALSWLKPHGLIQIEVPSSDWLTNKIYNLVYRFQGLDYVGNISPMHSPYHLYEFGLESFKKHSKMYKYDIAQHQYLVCETYLPKVFDPIIKPIMRKTNTGMQLDVWLRKNIN